jgi:hypothetical protein
MEKFSLCILLFCIVMTAGYFGDRLGYTVEGVPHGKPALASGEHWQDADYGLDVVFAFWRQYAPDVLKPVVGAIEYLTNFASFNIDNTPDWMVMIVDLITLLAIVLLFVLIRGNA